MSTEINYSIDGKSYSGLEYLELIEDVFHRTYIDTACIQLQNGESITLGGCSGCVSILHHRNDGTTWSPNEEVTKELVISLIEAFIQGDTERLSSHGATLLPPKEHKGADFSEGGKINRVLTRLFLFCLGIGLIATIICGTADVPNILWSVAFLFFALALFIVMFAGLAHTIDTCQCFSKSITTSSRFKLAGSYFVLICWILFLFICSVIIPLSLIIFLALKIFNLLM